MSAAPGLSPRARPEPPVGLIGVIHLPPMPGDPKYEGGGFGAVEESALHDAEAWAEGGASALIVENFGSAPFRKGSRGSRLPPHQVAFMAVVARVIKESTDLRVGVNCLRNDARSAIGIAAAAGLDFVRINVHVGAYVTDQGVIEGEAADTLRYRSELGAEVAILADVRVKHAAPIAPRSMGDEVRDALDRGLADGVIVTGSATGASVDADELTEVRRAAGDRAVYVGSGATPDLIRRFVRFANGFIVGTWAKRDGCIEAPVDPDRVAVLARACSGA